MRSLVDDANPGVQLLVQINFDSCGFDKQLENESLCERVRVLGCDRHPTMH
jgi:hypothetical protein